MDSKIVESLKEKYGFEIMEICENQNYNQNYIYDFWLKQDIYTRENGVLVKSDKCFYIHVYEGNGDNLLWEDIDSGYNDYFLYDVYDSLQDILDNQESNGGQCLLKQSYSEYTFEEIVDKVYNMF